MIDKALQALTEWARAIQAGEFHKAQPLLDAVLMHSSALRARNDLLVDATTQLSLLAGSYQQAQACQQTTLRAAENNGSVDWHAPKRDLFYALDEKSGLQLSSVLEDLRHTRAYLARHARAPTRLLFVGKPGSGKTVGAKWLASQLDLPLALIRIDGVMGGILGETSKKLRAAFEAAVERRSVIVIDEFEAVATPRDDGGPNVGEEHRRTTSALLQLIDSLPPEQILIGCTNVPKRIDAAARRRLRKHVFFHDPDLATRTAMISHWWRAAPHSYEAREAILAGTEGQSGDFLERVAEDANRSAVRREKAAYVASLSAADLKLMQASEATARTMFEAIVARLTKAVVSVEDVEVSLASALAAANAVESFL